MSISVILVLILANLVGIAPINGLPTETADRDAQFLMSGAANNTIVVQMRDKFGKVIRDPCKVYVWNSWGIPMGEKMTNHKGRAVFKNLGNDTYTVFGVRLKNNHYGNGAITVSGGVKKWIQIWVHP